MNKILYYIFLSIFLIFFSGCQTTKGVAVPPEIVKQVSLEAENYPQNLKDLYIGLHVDQPRNRVLYLLKLGLASYQMERFEDSEKYFDEALGYMEATNINNKGTKKALSLWHNEEIKDFKGEPYERVMAYFYRGMLYLRRGDYENARASFKAGILEDARSEEDQYKSDFKTMILLEALASKLNGDEELYKEAIAEFNNLHSNPIDLEGKNLFILFESGDSPVKYNSGKYGEFLQIRESYYDSAYEVTVDIEESRYNATLLDDISWQAMTRGGRPIEAILKDKVVYKEKTGESAEAFDKAGNVGLAAGAGLMAVSADMMRYSGDNNEVQAVVATVGATVFVVGAAFKTIGWGAEKVAKAMKTEADTRYWDNLPSNIFFLALDVKNSSNAVVKFYDNDYEELKDWEKKIEIDTSKSKVMHIASYTRDSYPLLDMDEVYTILNNKE